MLAKYLMDHFIELNKTFRQLSLDYALLQLIVLWSQPDSKYLTVKWSQKCKKNNYNSVNCTHPELEVSVNIAESHPQQSIQDVFLKLNLLESSLPVSFTTHLLKTLIDMNSNVNM